MNLDKAIDVSGIYGEVLEDISNKGFLMKPISKLPYPKDTIKLALRICLVGIKMEKFPRDLQNHCEIAYTSLADFIEDEQAEFYNEYMRHLSSPTVNKQVLDRDEDRLAIDQVVNKERDDLLLEVNVIRTLFQLT